MTQSEVEKLKLGDEIGHGNALYGVVGGIDMFVFGPDGRYCIDVTIGSVNGSRVALRADDALWQHLNLKGE